MPFHCVNLESTLQLAKPPLKRFFLQSNSNNFFWQVDALTSYHKSHAPIHSFECPLTESSPSLCSHLKSPTTTLAVNGKVLICSKLCIFINEWKNSRTLRLLCFPDRAYFCASNLQCLGKSPTQL